MTLVVVDLQDGQPDEVSLQAVALGRAIAGGAALHALAAGPRAHEAAVLGGGLSEDHVFVCGDRAAAPRPSPSRPVSCRYAGQPASSRRSGPASAPPLSMRPSKHVPSAEQQRRER